MELDHRFEDADPYLRQAEAFPRLSEDALERLTFYGTVSHLPQDGVAFRRGDRNSDFFVVLDGRIEVLHEHASGECIVATIADGQFTGELDMLNDRENLVSARAGVPTRVLRMERPNFHRMLGSEPDIGETVMRAFLLRRSGLVRYAQSGVVLIGQRHNGALLRLQQFLIRNAHPYRIVEPGMDGEAESLLSRHGLDAESLPVVISPRGEVMRQPTIAELSDSLGLTETLDNTRVHDLAIVGAGPAGLAAAVYGASEGLCTVIIEGMAPGGQAGTSSRIENYLGFPLGLSGQELAERAQVQAQKFGAQLVVSRNVAALDCTRTPYRLLLEDGQTVRTRSIVIATGARYRSLDVENYRRFEHQNIHYAATPMEAKLCAGKPVVVVGGGNSAGQAAVFLSRFASHVHMLIRGPELGATMSEYLVRRIHSAAKITLHRRTELVALDGERFLKTATWRNTENGELHTMPVSDIFVMIGAAPNTEWLGDCLELDSKGFVLTGRGGDGPESSSTFATALPGVFAVGDVRSGSIKRVAAGVGEGSGVIAAVHEFLAAQALGGVPEADPARTACLTQ